MDQFHPHLGRDILGSSCHTFGFHNCMDAFFQTLGWSFNTFQAKAFLDGVGTLIHQLILPGIQATFSLPTRHLTLRRMGMDLPDTSSDGKGI